MNRKKAVKEMNETRVRETYEFTAFVSGPLINYTVKAKDFDEAYGLGMGLLADRLKKYNGEVVLGKIQVERWKDGF